MLPKPYRIIRIWYYGRLRLAKNMKLSRWVKYYFELLAKEKVIPVPTIEQLNYIVTQYSLHRYVTNYVIKKLKGN